MDAYFVSKFFTKMGRPAPSVGSAVCAWPGVSCDGEGGVVPEDTVGKHARLQALDLSANHITTLSNDLWEVGVSLRWLDLLRNTIRDVLPNNVGNFTWLQVLNVSYNGFSGALPPALDSIAALQVLNASHNQF